MKDFSDTKPVGVYEDAVGGKNRDYYLDKFEDFDQKGEGWHASWNWAAFVGGGVWALYRKMYGWFFAWWFVATVMVVFAKVPNGQIHQILALILGVFWLAFSVYANAIYHRKIKARIAAARRSDSDPSTANRRLAASGGVHAWVLIVAVAVPVVGIVAAVMLPAHQDYTERQAAMEKPLEQTQTPVAAKRSQIDAFFDAPAAIKLPQASIKPGIEKAPWSGNPFDRFDTVASIEQRARQISRLNEQRAWAAVIAWQANRMEDGKTDANHALYDAVGTVLDGLNQSKGICRPGRTVFIDAATASESLPVGTPMTPWVCDR